MISFFSKKHFAIFAVHHLQRFSKQDLAKLLWLFEESEFKTETEIKGYFIGPHKEMVSPWSTNAVEITQSMGMIGIKRIEEFLPATRKSKYDPMLQSVYQSLNQQLFEVDHEPTPNIEVNDIGSYNRQEGLALSHEEVNYLTRLSKKIGRALTDSEVFGFSQVNSEHCRHKIFNGKFVINGQGKEKTLFELIKATSAAHGQNLASAYKDNVAFIKGPSIEQFAPSNQERPDYFTTSQFASVLSLKAETHNFPTTVEPFYGASTGTGGEIRDRLAGGKASTALAGTAVYMTSYPRLGRQWESRAGRQWLYQTPLEILIKASNGASDFGNKFGQPLICGSLLTFEYEENRVYGYDKVVMLAGGVGYAKLADSQKATPSKDDLIVILGGDNYRIGMGGGAVSSVATGEFENSIELNAVQRANPEMQKRVANAIRALAEARENPIVSIHDHGAGGHLNCLSELVEEVGGNVNIDDLPVGDHTLSDREIIGNESQERMGLIIAKENLDLLRQISERERAPMYVVGKITGDKRLVFVNNSKQERPIDLDLKHFFGGSPQTVLVDKELLTEFRSFSFDETMVEQYLHDLLRIEAVACKDWLTNKVDRSVTGKVATQQTTGPIQLPLNNLGVMALDYRNHQGVATSLGHAPAAALINPDVGSRLAITRALTNLIWAPLKKGLKGVSLSANWMWPANTPGENARLYRAVEALSEFAIALQINVPTGKDSLSMTQKYPDGSSVYSPGTVIVSAVAEVKDIRRTVSPCLQKDKGTELLYIDFSSDERRLAGSSFAQTLGAIGNEIADVRSPQEVIKKFDAIQDLISSDTILAGHDIGAGGLLVTLLEMTFCRPDIGLNLDLRNITEQNAVKLFFSENPGIVIQVRSDQKIQEWLQKRNISFHRIGETIPESKVLIRTVRKDFTFDIPELRDIWFHTSYLLDSHQTSKDLAQQRFKNYKNQVLQFQFPEDFRGELSSYGIDEPGQSHGIKAAIIREKGVNGDREMAYSMYLAGFDVKDVHMTDLVSGKEDLKDVNFIAFVGGFSNSDVLGSAKGWAGAFLYNQRAKESLDRFYSRPDTLSLGVCNGCQLMATLDLLYPDHKEKIRLRSNSSGKFESAFLNVIIPENKSILLESLSGSRLGAWIAHGEGRFHLPLPESHYQIVGRFAYDEYPGNPNGSDYSVAALCSQDGRHLAMMPHLERSVFSWQWAHYPETRKRDLITPWFEAFTNARDWIKEQVATRHS